MVTPASFRQTLIEFGDAGTYTDAQIEIWVATALLLMNANRWGSLIDLGTCYFVAHHLVLGQQNKLAALAGGTPGKLKGPTSAQGVDKVSASYDTSAISLENMGFWGLTQYGLRFLQLGRSVGAGGLQITGGTPPVTGTSGWPGLV